MDASFDTHHAVCDGFLVGRFMNALQEYAREHFPFKTIWSFTSMPNKSSERVMPKIGMEKVKEFPHPAVPENHPLKPHVLYRIENPK